MDIRQRLLILDAMSAAASDLSCPSKSSKSPPPPAAAAVASTVVRSSVDPRTGGKLGRTRVWGHRSLELRASGAAEGKLPSRNRFTAEVATAWVLRMMHQYDVVGRHGASLMGDDCLVLGRLLIALGAFVEASGQAGSATPALGAAVLELVAARGIANHSQVPALSLPSGPCRRGALCVRLKPIVTILLSVNSLPASSIRRAYPGRQINHTYAEFFFFAGGQAFVRRCMLLATAHVLGVLSVASVQAALEARDPGLAQGLAWVQEAMPRISTDDVDPECCTLAYGCFHLASELVQRAVSHRAAEAPDAMGSLLHIFGGSA